MRIIIHNFPSNIELTEDRNRVLGSSIRMLKSKQGFILGVVLLVCLVMAAFIFSFNSIVRSRNIQAHHMATSETASCLAMSAIRICASEIGDIASTTIQVSCPDLFTKKASELSAGLTIGPSTALCSKLRQDVQNFFDTMTEIKEAGVISGGLPTCLEVSVSLKEISAANPDTIATQFQKGRDPIEKFGKIAITCKIECRGIQKNAELTRQFRVVSMVPGPYCRFSLFVPHTPYPDSYNAIGSRFDGTIDSSYSHLPAGGKTLNKPLIVYNGTDTSNITPSIAERSDTDDKKHLGERGWVFLGPSGSGPSPTGPVFLKIPSGFHSLTGGNFMMGWPSASVNPILLPEIVADASHFAVDSDYADYTYKLGCKYQGFYTWEPGNSEGAGNRNLWPRLTSAPGVAYAPTDRHRAASSWVFPYGRQGKSSRTLVIGPVLAGFLKFYFIKGTDDVSGSTFKGLFSSTDTTTFDAEVLANKNINEFAMWGGVSANLPLATFYKSGFNSFKRLMPFNTLPAGTGTLPSNGVAFNVIFDFMKYNKTSYPDIDLAPSLANSSYDSKKILIPRADRMRTCPIPGIHPVADIGIFFDKDEGFNPTSQPDNCYFHGDLTKITNSDSNLISKRMTHALDLSAYGSANDESQAFENYLFRAVGGKNVPQKTGIFFIKRRSAASNDYGEALRISSKKINLTKPLIIVVDKGSVKIERDILSATDSSGTPTTLFSLVVCDGDIYLTGPGSTRTIHGYLSALGKTVKGRLLNYLSGGSGITNFKIFGGLAISEMGLPDPSSVGARMTTMDCFIDGGEIHYNSRFNPSTPSYAASRVFVSEELADEITISGGG